MGRSVHVTLFDCGLYVFKNPYQIASFIKYAWKKSQEKPTWNKSQEKHIQNRKSYALLFTSWQILKNNR